MEQINQIINVLEEQKNETSVPKNVRKKLDEIIEILKDENMDILLKKDKAIHLLDEVSEDPNIQPFVRTQIWSLVSMLESL